MISVSEQIDRDASLTLPLLRVRNYLASIGRDAELDTLLALWDASASKSDFGAVAAHFPAFLNALLNVTDAAPTAAFVEGDDEVRYVLDLLRQAIAGMNHQTLSTADSAYLEDVCGDVGGLLEELLRFNEPSAYAVERNLPEWLTETMNFEELAGGDQILLSDCIFCVDGFVTNLITARRNWVRWLERDYSLPAI
ncbi:hypothetical protein HFO49_34505 [Rhizobium leguminosarum]|uniref:hypothetical protein n=1 Tax=Rhizobium leguminosarum TaxID=384 RepID=UPI001C979250|nr:hypothetical protein [Rhizobium leguminosarum]MBY5592473.1 hypothetical protein [Rhizobium leguminosarum]